MKIELKEFQVEAADEIIDQLESARFEAAKDRAQAISLASPTGSGKTVIATSVIERLLEGDNSHSADPEATFLWITDQPELNEQTRNKMLATSSVLTPAHLGVVDATFDSEVFEPGHAYFLNTQKLGRNSLLIRSGDERNFTLWQTISNTIEARPTNFYVIVDEAHRGMQQPREREEANTIIQKFIKGSPGEIPAVPIIIAISATIERFNEVVAKTSRVKRQWEVPIEDVRASGLLKDAINLFHPEESQPGDITMLREAARAWKGYRDRWARYATSEEDDIVRPVLLVQVQDASGKGISKTDLGEALRALSDELDAPPAAAFAHAFQEGGSIDVDSTAIRYLAPSTIDADPDVQVVFFKTSLNTGWDCPRAEVMMSFRVAQDDTLIAQLVGRMVRAPLARPIQSDEHLNTVALYLPHYDQAGLRRVIERLHADDPGNMPPAEVREGKQSALLARADDSEKAFDLLASLPSYVIPRAKFSSQVRRLKKLATLLGRFGIDDEAPETETAFLVDVLSDERAKRETSKDFKSIVKESGVLDVRMVQWRYDPETLPEQSVQVEVSDENVDDLFAWAGRRLSEGLHLAYWKARVADGATKHRNTKLEAYALAASQEVIERLQSDAQTRVQVLLKQHDTEIKQLPEAGRQAINEIRGLALDPELTNPVYPETAEAVRGSEAYYRHLYVDSEGSFSFKTTSWERAVMDEELGRDDVVAWLRNPDRKPWSLCIPYEIGKAKKGCYPDFIVVRKQRGQLVADIVDPHLLSFEDAWHRAKGLAEYAARHADRFGRIEMVRVKDGKVDRIDLMDEKWRERVLDVSSNQHLRDLFDN